jgi:PAS domain S-box-containing protein
VPESAKSSLTATRATITQITESLARIVREYHPAELLGLGLEDTVRAHARQLAERHRLALHLSTVRVEGWLTPEQELHVYRVVQEALANTARHARAESVAIDISRVTDATQASDQLVVAIRDDGRGFDPDAPPAHGIGLATMHERAMLMHGTLAIQSDPDRGTCVRLVVPLAPPPPHPDPAWKAAAWARTSQQAAAESQIPAPLPEVVDLELFRQMADMASEAFQLCDHEGRFVYVNDRACTQVGYSREELLTMRVGDLNPDFTPEAWRAWIEATHGPVPPFEAMNRRRDGSRVPIEVCATPVDVGNTRYFFAIIRDITDRKKAEAAERGFTRRLLHTLEAERRRVARELHDEVGQAIAAVGVLLHTIERSARPQNGEPHPELAATHATIRQITESVARIVRDYHPAELLGLGLEETLRTHARQFTQRHGLALRLSTTAVDGLFSDEHALHVYRIVQEALANVARHGHARRVSVQLARHGLRVTATVRDDGVGFDPGNGRSRGLGLVTMRERAELIGGALDVRSSPHRGTEIRLTVVAGR